ncbi:OLC1v1001986C1 [Oldenlandia corymbosa var. corymbosa]|uniref:OLC1v1001986C1 n=1 Tax=Oldenlandia corymbosa var. corymbosa TaxID=529605 RepID=A0AAV1D6K2_OLDCO|nr:OLC1v1001986C1 [Oldenlandia corymbosa var. corymbosa]
MSTSLPPPQSATSDEATDLFAAVDMGTNSFKLLIFRADPSTGRFLPINVFKEPVLLGIDTTTTSAAAVITPASTDRAIAALIKFQEILQSNRIPASQCRVVATSAVREASNQSQFLSFVNQKVDLQIKVLSGQEEARLIYLGVLQLLPVIEDTVLNVDIGGGSTEFIIGHNGNILYSISLKLGHVTLTQQFSDTRQMREHIRTVFKSSGLVDKIKDYRINKVTGSSGTIKSIEEAVYKGYAKKRVENARRDSYSDWKFSKEELMELVDSFEMEGKENRKSFFRKRAEFIVAGAVLLEEAFESLGIMEMEVSEYALAEGVVAEMLGIDESLKVDMRWGSVVRLATRLCSKKKMKTAAFCARISKEIFDGIRKLNVTANNELLKNMEDRDIEYLEAACLLHKIGLIAGNKGYHKQSYQLITKGNHLQGYNDDEIMFIGLLVKHHRKGFPKADDTSMQGFTEEVKHKFTMLCAILRLSAVIEQLQSLDCPRYTLSHSPEGFRLVLEVRNRPSPHGSLQLQAEMVKEELDKEVANFSEVFGEKLSVVVH